MDASAPSINPGNLFMLDSTAFLRSLFHEAVAAVQPEICLAPALRALAKRQRQGRLVVVGAGKAAGAMAVAAENILPAPLEGLVITRYGHAAPTEQIEVREAAHPVPDAAGVKATEEILDLVRPLGERDTLLVLLSGGGSALLTAPHAPLDLKTKQDLTMALLEKGATISEINTLRKHLSAVKGGRLAAVAFPAEVLTLAISDVATDDPSVIASGPTVADSTTKREAADILARYAPQALAAFGPDIWQKIPETPKPGCEILQNSRFEIVASAKTAISAAIETATGLGLQPVSETFCEEGEASAVAQACATLLLSRQGALPPDAEPLLLLSSGEFTVTHGGTGKGGPNHEFLLALAIALEGADGIWALSCDTDGIDGTADAAGGTIGPETLAEMAAAGLDPVAALKSHDSAAVFMATGSSIVTGPTHTNVNDFRAFLIEPPGAG